MEEYVCYFCGTRNGESLYLFPSHLYYQTKEESLGKGIYGH